MEPYQGYKSAIIFLLPELMKQGLLQYGSVRSFISQDLYLMPKNQYLYLYLYAYLQRAGGPFGPPSPLQPMILAQEYHICWVSIKKGKVRPPAGG